MSAMGNALSKVKHAPKWAIYASGGIAAGAIGLKLFKARATADNPDGTASGAAPVDQIGAPTYAGTGSPIATIVPPVIIDSGSADQSGVGLGALQDLYFSGTQSLLDTAQGFLTTIPGVYNTIYEEQVAGQAQVLGGYGQLVGQYDTALGSLGSVYKDVYSPIADQNARLVANAGAPPQSVIQNPTPVQGPVYQPPPPAQIAPPPPAAAKPDACTGAYPNNSSQGCYKVVCASGKGDHAKGRWHYYANGREVRVANAC